MAEVITKIADHVDAAVHRVLRRSKRPVAVELVTLLVGPVQDIEDLAYSVLIDDVDTAVGVRLDQYGSIVGLDRFTADDDEYRAALRVKVLVNTTDGVASEVVAAFAQYLGTNLVGGVRYTQYGAAHYQLDFEVTVPLTATQIEIIQQLFPLMSPSGVGHVYIEGNTGLFRFDTADRGLDLGLLGRRIDV